MSYKKYLALAFMKMAQLLPVDNRKVVFTSFFGRSYNDSPKIISDRIDKLGGYHIVWVLEDGVDAPETVKRVKPESLSEIIELATAKYWVDNSRKSAWIRKKKNQVYFQTWHGAVCLKAIEADAPSLDQNYVDKAKNDSKMIDYLLSQCEWRTENFHQCFWYSGEYIKGDTVFIDDEKIQNVQKTVRGFYDLSGDVKILLYAPTFRNSSNTSCYDLDFEMLIEAISNRFGGEWIVLYRKHPNMIDFTISEDKEKGIYDGSAYPIIEDLILSSEVLITDYSGCMFDGFKNNKIVLLYANDYERYITEERSLYFDLSSFPAPLAKSNTELENTIASFDYDKYIQAVKEFNEMLGYYPNDGIEQIIDMIVNSVCCKNQKVLKTQDIQASKWYNKCKGKA